MKIDYKKYHLNKNDNIIIAVSGGVDSMALLDILSKIHNTDNIIVAHCNHGFRKESILEAKMVENICNQLNVHFEMKEAVNLKNQELAAREFRYEFFYELMEKYSAKALFVGHHKNDQVETVFFRLMRGAGLTGLSGMKEHDKERKIIRPFLKFTKEDILEYAKANNLKWMDDATNFEVDYDRCWLRNDIIPALEERKPGIANVISKTAENLSEVADFMSQEAEKWIHNQENKDYSEKQKVNNVFMSQTDFKQLHVAMQKEVVLHLYVKHNGSRQGVRQVDVENIIKWIKGMKPGSCISFGNVTFRNYGDFVAYK